MGFRVNKEALQNALIIINFYTPVLDDYISDAMPFIFPWMCLNEPICYECINGWSCPLDIANT